VIFEYSGTLDKFMGDGIMVEFGAPLDDENQEQHALLAAAKMFEGISKLNEKWKLEGKPTIRVGMGINTGLAVVGNIGSLKRLEYTAIGDTVNVASRLEEATKTVQEMILFTEATYEAVKDRFPCRYLGEITVQGRHEPVRIYTIDRDKMTGLTK
jgi:adenylate cyclase